MNWKELAEMTPVDRAGRWIAITDHEHNGPGLGPCHSCMAAEAERFRDADRRAAKIEVLKKAVDHEVYGFVEKQLCNWGDIGLLDNMGPHKNYIETGNACQFVKDVLMGLLEELEEAAEDSK